MTAPAIDRKQEIKVRVGVVPACPVDVITVGGIEFPRYTEKVYREGGEWKRDKIHGSIKTLEVATLEAALKASERKIVRATTSKRGTRARVYTRDNEFFRPEAGDIEASTLIYAEPVVEDPYKEPERKPLGEFLAEINPPAPVAEKTPPKRKR